MATVGAKGLSKIIRAIDGVRVERLWCLSVYVSLPLGDHDWPWVLLSFDRVSDNHRTVLATSTYCANCN